MTSGAGAAGHSLAFRVMRLCRPSCHVDQPLLFDPDDLTVGEDSHEKSLLPIPAKKDAGYWKRFDLQEPIDAMGLSGLLVLPQTFGSIYLGETFCSYISVGNDTTHDVRDVVIKAELQTERQRILLADNTRSPIDTIRATGRFDFIIEHDIKELGAHTLVCMAVYTDVDGDRKYLPQYFKFTTSNPVSVRTKVRTIKETTYLEACIENQTKGHLFMDQVRFEPTTPWTSTIIEVDYDNDINESDGPISDYIKKLQLISGNGGARHYLFQLKRSTSTETVFSGSNTLGKLEIMWRTALGETGRLQTQQILGSPIPHKEIELKLVELPPRIILRCPFLVRISVSNRTDHPVGPLTVSISQADDNGTMRSIVVNGLWTLTVPLLQPYSSTDLAMSLVATAVGVQRISGIAVVDVRDGKPYDILPSTEVFVEAE